MWFLFTGLGQAKRIVTPVFQRQRQELKLHFKTSLGYRFILVIFW